MTATKLLFLCGMTAAALCGSVPGHAQSRVQDAIDRADPAVTERELGARLPAATVQPEVVTIAPSADAAAGVGDVMVARIAVDGAVFIEPSAFASVYKPYLDRRLGAADLKMLVEAIGDVARARGYVFASAVIPPQIVSNGTLRVMLHEGSIDDVRVSGDAHPALTRRLMVLTDGRPVTRARLERAVLLAGDLPATRVVRTRFQMEGRRGVLLVDTSRKRVVGNLEFDNWGSSTVGPVRLRARVDLNDAFFAGDQLTLRSTLTPLQPRELATIGFDYSVDTGYNGLLAGFGSSFTRVQPGKRARDDQIDGRSSSLNANLSYPVMRTLDANLWTTADFTVRDVEQDRDDRLVRDDRFATLTLGASGYFGLGGGWAYGRVGARQGLGILDATREGDPLASRTGGSAKFSKLDMYVDWVGPIAGPLGLRVAAEGQIASRALLSSEEMGIGGPRFGRAYDYSERSGDRGIAGSAELRYDLRGGNAVGRTTQLYTFVDAATVGNAGTGGRGGALYSAGAGIRFDLSKVFDAGAEIAFPIGHDRFETRNRDPRLSFTVSARF